MNERIELKVGIFWIKLQMLRLLMNQEEWEDFIKELKLKIKKKKSVKK